MERLARTLVAVLIVCVAALAYCGVRLSAISEQLHALQIPGYGDLLAELSSLRTAVSEVGLADQWASYVEVRVGEPYEDLVPVDLIWQIAEMSPGASVEFFMRPRNETDFTRYEVVSTGGGNFRVSLEVPYELNPIVHVSTGHSGNRSSSASVTAVWDSFSGQAYEYYICVTDSVCQKTTRLQSLDLGKIGSGELSPLHLSIEHRADSTRVSLAEEDGPHKYRLLGVEFQILYGSEKIVLPLTSIQETTDRAGKFSGRNLRPFSGLPSLCTGFGIQ